MIATVTGAVHSWDVSTGVDGPGTRFVVFLAGCPLRCRYCQNPDTWRMRREQRTDVDALWGIARRYARFIEVAGGGLTVIANAPNPAGVALLRQGFNDGTIGAGGLLAGALAPTVIAALAFLL